MGYQFNNNWPYTYTSFPTMLEHIDPQNNTYFSGLHSEIQNIEYELGLDPAGSYNTVKERLDALFSQTGYDLTNYDVKTLVVDVNNNTTSWAEITQLEINLTTGANDIFIYFSGVFSLDTATAQNTILGHVYIKVDDGWDIAGGMKFRHGSTQAKQLQENVNIIFVKAVSSSSHKIEVWWKTGSANTNIFCNPSTSPTSFHAVLAVFELKPIT